MSAKFAHKGTEKKKYVKQMFNDISNHYDKLNLLSSFGIDRYWRRILVKKVPLSDNDIFSLIKNSFFKLSFLSLIFNIIFTSLASSSASSNKISL